MRKAAAHSFFCLILIIICVSGPPALAGTYYIDSAGGNDANAGTSSSAAWQSLGKVNGKTFLPGDSILFKAGGTWTGQLYPKGSGSAGRPIVIGMYGSGAAPRINGNADSTDAVYLYNQQYWVISSLEITNYRAGVVKTLRGVYIKAYNLGVVKYIRLVNLYIHDVNGDSADTDNGGIVAEITGTSTPTWFDSLIIENNKVLNVTRTGICNLSSWSTRTLTTNTNWTPSTNLIVRNNWIERTANNGLIVRVAAAPLIEGNYLRQCGLTGSGNAMFVFNCDDALIQYNEACFTVENSGDTDAAGFDADYRCKRTIIQYNYSHDNEGGAFVVVCQGGATRFNDSTIVRYNISQNDRGDLFKISGQTTNTFIYNNIIYSSAATVVSHIVWHKSWSAYPDGTSYYNNIFYLENNTGVYTLSLSTNNLFDYNVFYGAHDASEPADSHKITANPLLVNPGSGATGILSLDGYKIQSGSPCINSALVLPFSCYKDFWGYAIPDPSGTPDRGAYEYNSSLYAGTAYYYYHWTGAASEDFSAPLNWNPSRLVLRPTDILLFDGGGAVTVTGVTSQSIARIALANGTRLTLAAASPSASITVSGSSGADVALTAADSLTITGAYPLVIAVASGATGSIAGHIVLKGGAHKITAVDSASLLFAAGSSIRTTTGFTSNAFGTTALNSVVFSAGSVYINGAGANPFGATAPATVVVWQPGSIYRHVTSGAPSLANRAYAVFEYAAPDTVSYSTSSPVTLDSLLISSGVFNLSAKTQFTVKGNIVVSAGAALNLSPTTAGTLNLSGTARQHIRGGGTFYLGTLQTLAVNNSSGIEVSMAVTAAGPVQLSSGRVFLSNGSLLLKTTAALSGSFSPLVMFVPLGLGELRREFSATGAFQFPVGDTTGTAEYTPATVTFTSGTFSSGAWAGIKVCNARHPKNLSKSAYLNRYWSFSTAAISAYTCSLTAVYTAADVFGSEALLFGAAWSPPAWSASAAVNTLQHTAVVTGIQSNGDISAGQQEYVGAGVVFTVTAHPEALYNPETGRLALQDTILLLLAPVSNPLMPAGLAAAVLDSVTATAVTAFPGISSGQYYVVLRHRNSLETWSSEGGMACSPGYVVTHSFSDSGGVFGNNTVLKGGKRCLISGDVNQDGLVDLNDLIAVDNDNSGFLGGYIVTDLNGDGITDLNDLIVVDNNNAAFASVKSPAVKSNRAHTPSHR